MNIEEIKEKINNNEYSLVPDKIAIGEVIKIHIKGDLNIDGYETGYLYLRPNTGIKEHEPSGCDSRIQVVAVPPRAVWQAINKSSSLVGFLKLRHCFICGTLLVYLQ